MVKLRGMELTKQKGIAVASSEEIREALHGLTSEASARRRYLARKVTTQALVNGLVLWLGSLAAEDRRRVVDEALDLIGDVEQDRSTVEAVLALSRSLTGDKEGRAGSPSAGSEIQGRGGGGLVPLPSKAIPEGRERGATKGGVKSGRTRRGRD